MTAPDKPDIIDELEDQLHNLQSKLLAAKDSYISRHQKEYDATRKQVAIGTSKVQQARDKVAKATANARKSSSATAQNQLKKARASIQILSEAVSEARDIMATEEDKLKVTKPFEKKLAARARALASFEREWLKKEKDAERARKKRAAERKKAAREKAKAKAKSTASQ